MTLKEVVTSVSIQMKMRHAVLPGVEEGLRSAIPPVQLSRTIF